MAQARRKKTIKNSEKSAVIATQLQRGLREGAMLVLMALALFLFTALITYDTADPGWSYTGTREAINNAAGAVGAWFSDVLYNLFGYLSFLFPIIIAYSGWLVLRSNHIEVDKDIDYHEMGIRWAGFFVTVAMGCALTSMHFSIVEGQLPLDGGGVLGVWLSDAMAGSMGLLGSTLILLAVFLAGITLFSGISWFRVIDAIGVAALFAYDWTQEKVLAFIEGRQVKKAGEEAKQQRQEVVAASKVKQAVRESRGTKDVRIEPVMKKVEISERMDREKQIQLFDAPSDSELPALRLLDPPKPHEKGYSNEALEALSRLLEIKLADFGVEVEVVAVHPGPVITRFEMEPAPGVKASKITALSKDLARSLSVPSILVVEVIPGKTCVGLEIPNEHREIVSLSEILMSKEYDNSASPLTLGLGKDIAGHPVVADLGKMPHLLVAGTTGSGKSVCVNALLISLLYKSKPDEVRLILIDPKMLELNVYEGIAHLLTPVVTDMKEAANALRWCVGEMESRYELMSGLGVRNIAGFNRKVKEAIDAGKPLEDPTFNPDHHPPGAQPQKLKPLPYIVVVVDEFADLFMVVGKKIEELIARITQKARAAGIHLILATQRPSVDVVTGLIKSNIPTRIAFQVSSRVDSRTILDQMGAENLLGHGDMLYMEAGSSMPTRIHGAFVDDHEVHRVVAFLKEQNEPDYIEEILQDNSTVLPGEKPAGANGEEVDALYDEAIAIVTQTRKASISYVQRRLKIGYNRAARMIEEMEAAGVVSAMQSNGSREVLAPPPPEG
ncbi:MAG: DNA translocase FtsK 4TM domain-containing protein [Gammaproteobacteria bacterium]|nr:DNA translocase FtsK 4TM domain-containing protein [Gammaproteobacteria bacterium]